ncbi:MAG: pyridoxal phosphate-dependent aminotransferase [Bacteroidetes bacterium]|nr:pyridoxal phosphate-dependent aminotransferase [Bacteroidota bacterium]
MPDLSYRAVEMPESPIRKLIPFAEDAKKRGITVYHLNIGQPDIETPAGALDAVHNSEITVLEYSHSAGIESFRNELSHYYRKNKIDVSKDDILVTTGGSEAIFFALMCCLNPGDEIIIPEPFYTNYNGFAVAAGVKIVPVTTHIENGFALPEIEKFNEKITTLTKAILICNPNNPTGYLYSRKELDLLSELVRDKNLYLLADEVYREFCYDGAEFLSVMNLKGAEENVVMLDSISKRYSMCGARIGTLVTRNKKIKQAALKYAQARLSPPTFGQIAGKAAISTPESYFTKVLKEYSGRRNLLVDMLNNMDGVQCPVPKGAFYAMARLPIDDSDKFCRWLLEKFNHNGRTVMLAPATGFYATKGLGKDEVRIGYVLNIDSLKNAMQCLQQGLKQYSCNTIIEESSSC